jgi:sporulation related protein
MRWVFFCVLILNIVYLVWSLAVSAVPTPVSPSVLAPSDGRQLTLLAEAGVVGDGGVQVGATTDLCVTLGPWASVAPAQKQLQELSRKGYAGRVSPVQVAKDRLHWVYLPALESREAALKVLRDLQSKKVDSFIVGEGADENAISLGYFSSPDSARGLSVKMQTAGYPAETRETERVETEYWLYFATSGVPDDGAAIRDVIAANSALSGKNVACRSQPSMSTEEPREAVE